MPKRSLNPGNSDTKKVEQLHKAVEAMLSRKDGKAPRVEAGIEPLVRIAAELRNLPNARFKARLMSELTQAEPTQSERTQSGPAKLEPAKSKLGGRKRMSTLAEPIAAAATGAAPRLAFLDPAKAIEFYKKALGAKEVFRFEVGGQIPHAELKIGDSSINVTGEWPEGGRFSAETLGHSPISLVISVPDVDAFAKHAAEAGMKMTCFPPRTSSTATAT